MVPELNVLELGDVELEVEPELCLVDEELPELPLAVDGLVDPDFADELDGVEELDGLDELGV